MKAFLTIVLSIFLSSQAFAAKDFCVGDTCCGTFRQGVDKIQINDCPALEAILKGAVPAPTPVPTAIPTAKPTADPTGVPVACESTVLANSRQRTTSDVTLEINKPRTWCMDLPAGLTPGSIVEFKTVNRANTSCSDVLMEVTAPNGQKLTASNGSQPGVAGFAQVGTYLMKITQRDGSCFRYVFTANW